MTTVSNTNAVVPVKAADPTVVFVVKQAGYTISSLAMVAATVILALNHFIQDGEIVTLLVTAVGAHVLASVNGTATTTQTDTSASPGGTITTVPQNGQGSVTTVTASPLNAPSTSSFHTTITPGQ